MSAASDSRIESRGPRCRTAALDSMPALPSRASIHFVSRSARSGCGLVDRVYKHRKAEVEEALQALKAYATNRLPVLEGS